MSDRVTDAPARQRALDPGDSFIVQAPAGSGKTELLTQRFLRLLECVEHPESVVAITFTRKAAGEMRARIVEALRGATGPAPEKEHERLTWELARAALARDRRRGWQLLDNPSRLRIQTIDSLCAALVRQMPWVSRFGAVPQVQEDADPLYREAARNTLALLETSDPSAGSLERLVRHLDNNFATLEGLLIGMLSKRDQWLRHVVPNAGSETLRQSLEQALANVIRDALEDARAAVPYPLASELVEIARSAAANLRDDSRDSPVLACLHLEELPGAEPRDLAPWLGIAELLLTQKGERRKRLDVSVGFPPTAIDKQLKQRCLALDLDEACLSRLHALRSLPSDRFDDAQWEVLEALLEVLPVAAAQLKLVFRSKGMVDFPEIAQAARQALGTPEQPTDLAFSLDYRIQHLLVDEFQDTSHSQYELLAALTAEWLPGDGRTLFLVGDPMQSIYGFREAEVALFLRARQEGIGNLRPTPLTLEVNFRSGAGIVEWVNQAFQSAFPVEENRATGGVTYSPSVAFHGRDEGPAVTIHPFLNRNDEAEAERTLSIIKEARQGDPQNTIAILVRARTHLFAIVPRLQQAGLRFRAVDIDQLGERPVVQDLLALTRALLHAADRPAWLAILRAPWCGLTLADLLTLAGDDLHAVVWDLLRDEGRIARLSEDGRSRVARLRAVLEAALVERGRLPLRRWVEGTWMALGGPACLDNRTSLEDAAAYLDLLEASTEGADLTDLESFTEKVSALFAQPDVEADGTLQLLTVHKAKGLEFDTVIVPGLGRRPRPDEPVLLQWLERVRPRGQPDLLLAPIRATGADEDRIYKYVKGVDKEKGDHESTRLLYVAATRARKRLHLLAHLRQDAVTGKLGTPEASTLLSKIWDAVRPGFERAAEAVPEVPLPPQVAVAAPPPVTAIRRLPADWQLPAPPPEVAWQAPPEVSLEEEAERISFEWVRQIQRHVGTVVHALLQRIATTGEQRWGAANIRAALLVEGVPHTDLEQAVARVETAFRATLQDERGRWILAPHQDAHSEYALAGTVNGRTRHFIVDRTFVDESSVRWIIDYKTGTHEGGDLEGFLDSEQARYRLQLEHYAALMRGLDARPIRLGLYFPLLQAWREWPAEEAVKVTVPSPAVLGGPWQPEEGLG
jgi:ATP-dependent exoDNAse (exonuclease V) beta subunit